MDWKENYQLWLEKTADNEELHLELMSIAGDEQAIENRFYRDLAFGTGGLRGVLGAGTNRMNVCTVAKATQGLANYLKRTFSRPSTAIAYDSRIHSDLFAETVARVFAANGVLVHLYPKLMPTPLLSFAVRDLGCSCGVVITASHNPAKYNGYKVYGPDGCQITTEAAKAIQKEIDRVDPFSAVRWAFFQDELDRGNIRYIPDSTVEHYLAVVGGASVGTEPKLKIYLTACGETKESSAVAAEHMETWAREWSAQYKPPHDKPFSDERERERRGFRTLKKPVKASAFIGKEKYMGRLRTEAPCRLTRSAE